MENGDIPHFVVINARDFEPEVYSIVYDNEMRNVPIFLLPKLRQPGVNAGQRCHAISHIDHVYGREGCIGGHVL